MSEPKAQPETACRNACGLHRIDTRAHCNVKTFIVHVTKTNGAHADAEFTAKELASYRAFIPACLERTGLIFGHECFENRGSAANWRVEIATALERGKVIA